MQRQLVGGCMPFVGPINPPRLFTAARVGEAAHQQIQHHFSQDLDSEVPIPRATKLVRRRCPAKATNLGRADLWLHRPGSNEALMAEIKSIHGRAFAAPETAHYVRRVSEVSRRMLGGRCPGFADAADRAFDANWLFGAAAARKPPTPKPLDRIVPPPPGKVVGPFSLDPKKTLKVQLESGGAVLYWCVKGKKQRGRVPVPTPLPIPGRGGSRVRRPLRTPFIIQAEPGFAPAWRKLGGRTLPARGRYLILVPAPLLHGVRDSIAFAQRMRMLKVNLKGNPVYAYRAALGIGSAIAAAMGIVLYLGLAVVVAAPVIVAALSPVASAAASSIGARLVTLFATRTTATVGAKGFATAVATVIATGVIQGGGSTAKAKAAIRRAFSDQEFIVPLEVTGRPLATGLSVGSAITFNGRPYRVALVLGT